MIASITLSAALFVCTLAQPVAEVEQRAVASRRAIARGRIDLDSRYSSGGKTRHVVTAIAWDGKKIRNDAKKPYDVRPAAAKDDFHTVRVIFNDAFYLWYDDKILADGHLVLIMTRRDEYVRSTMSEVIDAHLLGMVLSDSQGTRNYHLEAFLLPSEPATRTISKDRIEGVECWKVERTKPRGDVIRYWIAPSMDFNVMRWESELSRDGKNYRWLLENKVSRHPPSGVWFPSAYKYQEVVDDDLAAEEQLDIKVISLNQHVDPKLFTLEDMHVPAGVTAVRTARGVSTTAVWNGKQLVDQSQVVRKVLAPPAVWTGRRISLAIASTVCAFLGALLIWRYIRRSPLTANQ